MDTVRNRFHWRVLFALVSLMASGCQPSEVDQESAGADSTQTAVSPLQIIERCIVKYRKADRYEDRAVIRVASGQVVSQETPCYVAFQRPNRMWVETSTARCSTSEREWVAQWLKPERPDWTGQRWVRELPEKIDWDWLFDKTDLEVLLSDSELGLPIQLELLLHPKALAFFSSRAALLTQLPDQDWKGHRCHRIASQREDRQFVLWIDSKQYLLRKLEVFDDVDSAKPIGRSQLPRVEMDFVGSRFDTKIEWEQFASAETEDSLRLRKLVPPPPALESPLLDEVIDSFQLVDLDQNEVFDSKKKRPSPTILCWLANHPASERTARRLSEFVRSTGESGLDKHFEVIGVWSEPIESKKSTIGLWKSWGWELPMAIDQGEVGLERFQIKSAPTIALLGPNGKLLAWIEHDQENLVPILAGLLDDWLSGRDTSKQKRVEQQYNRQRFLSQLHALAYDRQTKSKLDPIGSFPPLIVKLNAHWTRVLPSAALAFAVQHSADDSKGDRAILLDEKGKVLQYDASGELQQLGEVPGEALNGASFIEIVPGKRIQQPLLIVPGDLGRFLVFDPKSTAPVRRLELEDGESVTAASWIEHEGSSDAPDFYVATTKPRVIAYSEQGDQLQSGETTKAIVAVITERQSAYDSVVALAEDGTILKITHSEDEIAESDPKKLPFKPAPGNWLRGTDRLGAYYFGLGTDSAEHRLAAMFGDRFEQLWSVPVATFGGRTTGILDRFSEPVSGSLYWLWRSPSSVLHFMRGDGQIGDQVSWGEPIIGAAILPSSEGPILITAFAGRVEGWRLEFPNTLDLPVREPLPANREESP